MAIITHAGVAHPDEVIACALVLHATDQKSIERIDHTLVPSYNKENWVVDVGKRYDPSLHFFDHHQDESLPPAFVLIARYLENHKHGYEGFEQKCKTYLRWWDFYKLRDLEGVQKASAVTNSGFISSPFELTILDAFAGKAIHAPSTWLVMFLEYMGGMIVNNLQNAERLIKELDIYDPVSISNEVLGLYFRTKKLTPDEFRFMLGIWLRINGKTPDFIIRYNSDIEAFQITTKKVEEKLDFRKLEGMPFIEFIHNSGFLVTIKTQDFAYVLDCINAAQIA